MIAQTRRMQSTAGLQGWLLSCVAALFVVLLSGLPTLGAELYAAHFECCGSECEGADDEGNCPPNCHYGTCAKTISTAPSVMSQILPAAALPQELARMELLPELSGVRVDVFHPPRA
jgi:hypothetical protein